MVSGTPTTTASLVTTELAKLPAFLRRDFLTAWSYRMSFFADAANLIVQAGLFYFIGQMIDPAALPTFGGSQATYLEFVAVGIALGAFIQLGIGRVALAIRNEQLMGTLESLLMTPTSITTIQVGSVVYDLIYIPVRTAIFLGVIAVAFGLDFELSGVLPASVALLAFIPFVWGIGVATAAATMTFRQGSAGMGFLVTVLTLGSGAYFPLELLPGWVADVAALNPIAIAIDAMRMGLLGGASLGDTAPEILLLLPLSVVSLLMGIAAFRLAVARERRLGTMGLY